MSEKRWENTEAFIITCKVFHCIVEAKKQLEYPITHFFSIEDVNTLQDMLKEQGYAIQKINHEKETNT